MSQKFVNYAEETIQTRELADNLAINLKAAGDAAGYAETVASALKKIDTNAKTLDDIASGLETVLKVVGKIGPMKAVTTPLKNAISAIENRAEEVRNAAGKVESKFSKYKTAFDTAEKTLSAASDAVEAAAKHMEKTEAGIADAASMFKNGHIPAQAAMALAAADAAANQSQELKALILKISPEAKALNDLLSSIDGAGSMIVSANNSLAGIIKSLQPISGPLETIANVVKPVEWALDAVDAVFNFVVSPILNPILDATGVNKLITNFVNGLNLPSLTPFSELNAKIDAIGNVLSGADGKLGEISDAVAAIQHSISPNGSTMATDGDDFIVGIDDGNASGTTVEGKGGHDFLSGGKGNDHIDGGDGNDVVLGGSGNDTIDGGNGFDVTAYDTVGSKVHVTNSNGKIYVDATAAGLGNDVLTGVERISFKDGNVAFDIDQNAGQAYRLYQAAFDRTPDADGLGYWIKEMDAGKGDLAWVAANFIGSKEFISTYGTAETVSNTDFVALLYANVLDRSPDGGGFDYWKSELDHGFARELVLASFSESVENQNNVANAVHDGIWYT